MTFTTTSYVSFAVPPKSVVVGTPAARREGGRVTVACTAEDSNPRTELEWFKEGRPILRAGKEKNTWRF